MLSREQWHPNITETAVMEAAGRRITSLDNLGFCLACGVEVEGVEPDAREYQCEQCDEEQVFGAEELIFEVVP